MQKRRIVWTAAMVILLALLIWALWGNKALEVTPYTVFSHRLPSAFDGFRIAHISDLHNTSFGKENRKLLALLEELQPDIIAITGDLIDSRNTKLDVALHFAAEAVKIAPCYYVPGNHESRIPEYPQLRQGLEELGVVVLEETRTEILREGERITLFGVQDPSFCTDDPAKTPAIMQEKLQGRAHPESYTILLSHRPELFDVYAENEMDLVLSGHVHGGQFRLPFVGGLFAPSQGFFPKYDAGLFTRGNTQMLISRGLGNSLFPLRLNNRPEILLIELDAN